LLRTKGSAGLSSPSPIILECRSPASGRLTGRSGRTFPLRAEKLEVIALWRAERLSKSRDEGLSRYERQSGREAAAGKWGVAVTLAQSLCRLSKGGYEPGVGVVERLADGLGRGVDERRRRAGERGGMMQRVLRQDRLDARSDKVPGSC